MSWCSAASSGPSSASVGEAGKLKGEPEGDKGEDGCDEKEESGAKGLLKQIADVSEEATRRSGLTFDDQSGMYYDAQSGLYYDQVGPLKGWSELHASSCPLSHLTTLCVRPCHQNTFVVVYLL